MLKKAWCIISQSRNIIAFDECQHLPQKQWCWHCELTPLFFVLSWRSQVQVHVWKKHRPQFLSLCPHAFEVSHSPTKIPAWLRILKDAQLHLLGKVLYYEHIVLWATNHLSTHVKTMTLESLAQMPTQYIQLIKKKNMNLSNVSINCTGSKSSPKHLTLSFLKEIYTQRRWCGRNDCI